MNEIFKTYAENAFETNPDYIEYILRTKKDWYRYNYSVFFPNNKDDKLLDIGPGLGEMLLLMKEEGYKDYYGIDISPSTIDYCTKLGLPCECVKSTPDWLNQHPNTFELITLLDVIEHVPKDQIVEFLEACNNALTDTGRIIIQTPNLQAAEGYLHRYNDFTHEFGFIEHTMNQVLMVSGFEMYQNFPFEEFTEVDPENESIKYLRSFFWNFIDSTRRLTHNLTPPILTPVFFAVAYKKAPSYEVKMSNSMIENRELSLEDMTFFCDKYGLKFELLERCKELFDNVIRLELANEEQEKFNIELRNQNDSLRMDLSNQNDLLRIECENHVNRMNDLQRQISDLANWNHNMQDQIISLTNKNQALLERLDKIPKLFFKK